MSSTLRRGHDLVVFADAQFQGTVLNPKGSLSLRKGPDSVGGITGRSESAGSCGELL